MLPCFPNIGEIGAIGRVAAGGFYLSATRSTKAAKRFLGKALRGLKDWEQPEVLNTDKVPTYAAAIAEIKAEGKCSNETKHRQVKYLNNVVEADHRNGHNRKRVLTDEGAMELEVPRDRAGRFEPRLVEKYCRRLPGFDDKVISMYARGMTTREIRGHIEELYGVSVSAELISKVTDAVLEEVGEWQSRPLEEVYAIVYFDAVRVKIRDEGLVRNKAVYLAVGVSCAGRKEVLGLWIEQTEGAKFWLSVMNELKTRGVADVLIAVVDGLKGFPEAIEAVFPQATVQTCIVHLIRRSLAYASYKERRALAGALKTVYRAPTQAAAEEALDAFEAGPWGQKYPAITRSWRSAWEHVVPFFAFSHPHSVQVKSAPFRLFRSLCPHSLHVMEVFPGCTTTVLVPVRTALRSTRRSRCPIRARLSSRLSPFFAFDPGALGVPAPLAVMFRSFRSSRAIISVPSQRVFAV